MPLTMERIRSLSAELSDVERLIVQRTIASVLDRPSVYMGGPSERSMRLADSIIKELLRQQRLHATECAHMAYGGHRQHGAYCPTCHMQIVR